jgi:predicted RNA-binding Zn ribbon-like protein
MSGVSSPPISVETGAGATSLSAAGRRQPAPGGLELVRAFLNSANIEEATDDLAAANAVGAWLRSHDLPAAGTEITEEDRERLVAVREALRDLITCREDGEPGGTTLGILDRAARSSPLIVSFDADGLAVLRSGGSGVPGAIARILGEITIASAAGTWPRLKVCRNDACRWAYYDASRNRSGIWCSMAVCGNRAKGRALRVRRRGATRA